MNENRVRGRKRPWRNALVATTGLSVFFLVATLLWNSGHQQWAFALFFLAVWVLISVSWSNMDFMEQSGSILARIVDHNFRDLHEKVDLLEKELDEIKAQRRINPDNPVPVRKTGTDGA